MLPILRLCLWLACAPCVRIAGRCWHCLFVRGYLTVRGPPACNLYHAYNAQKPTVESDNVSFKTTITALLQSKSVYDFMICSCMHLLDALRGAIGGRTITK